MSEPEHSPLPWSLDSTIEGDVVRDNEGQLVADTACNAHQIQNAAFIVTACNSYYDNKAAIAELVDCLGDMLEGDDGQAWKEARRVYEKYKAVKP